MSQASRIALATTSTFTCGMIAWVHFRQREEKNVRSALVYPLSIFFIFICHLPSRCFLLTSNFVQKGYASGRCP